MREGEIKQNLVKMSEKGGFLGLSQRISLSRGCGNPVQGKVIDGLVVKNDLF